MWAVALVDGDLIVRRLRVARRDVVFVKGIFEASEGLGAVFAQSKADARSRQQPHVPGDLIIAAPRSRAKEVDALLDDLRLELGVE